MSKRQNKQVSTLQYLTSLFRNLKGSKKNPINTLMRTNPKTSTKRQSPTKGLKRAAPDSLKMKQSQTTKATTSKKTNKTNTTSTNNSRRELSST